MLVDIELDYVTPNRKIKKLRKIYLRDVTWVFPSHRSATVLLLIISYHSNLRNIERFDIMGPLLNLFHGQNLTLDKFYKIGCFKHIFIIWYYF